MNDLLNQARSYYVKTKIAHTSNFRFIKNALSSSNTFIQLNYFDIYHEGAKASSSTINIYFLAIHEKAEKIAH